MPMDSFYASTNLSAPSCARENLTCKTLVVLKLLQKLQGGNRQDKYITRDDMQNWVNPKSVPSCLSLNLTTCTMRDFALAGQQRVKKSLKLEMVADVAEVIRVMEISSFLTIDTKTN
ncbi:hypothetical protein MTR_2g007350 [Medicago truncatula]|uniref:Uncharacterized protein n=1 Tax=Medicago truncatula TaxID=3880 RepID=G7IJX2_MEDTR|nr:hypothetical protein MTR_2g007350 [Medicago truncatula]